MSKRDGLRELSTDAQHLVFVVGGVASVVTVTVGAGWWWWGRITGMPPPMQGLVALAAAVCACLLWLFGVLICHHYLGWPKSHPFQMPTRIPLAPKTQGVLHQAGIQTAEPPTPEIDLTTASREARALAELKAKAERANSEAITEVSKPVKLRVGEVKNATHLVLGLELLSSEPTDHYALLVLDVALWYEHDGGSYSTIARFAESAKPWEISRWGGVGRLHRDAAAAYNLCTFANGPHVEHIAGRSRTTCKLIPGLYRFKLEFRGADHVHPHETFVRVDTKEAEFVGNG